MISIGTIGNYFVNTLVFFFFFRYMSRFDEELEEIEYIHSIGKRNCTQHSSRERMISHTKENEEMLFKSSGLEIPDIKSPTTYK